MRLGKSCISESRRCANVAEASAHSFERSDAAGRRETKRLYRAPVDLVDATAAGNARRLPAALSLAVVGCLVTTVQHATAHLPDAFPLLRGMSWGTVHV